MCQVASTGGFRSWLVRWWVKCEWSHLSIYSSLIFSPSLQTRYFCIYRQSHPHEKGQTLSVLANYVSHEHYAFLFLSALPVLIVPPGVFFLVSAQLRLQVAVWWWPQ